MNVGATVTRILVGVVFVQGLSWSALAQTSGVGSISGTVHDDAGLVIPGVTVVLTNADGTVGGNQEATTDVRGVYQFARLVPGSYSVKAALTGFKTTVREQVAILASVIETLSRGNRYGSVVHYVPQSPEVFRPTGLFNPTWMIFFNLSGYLDSLMRSEAAMHLDQHLSLSVCYLCHGVDDFE